MEVILLERVAKLGGIGDVVRVKNGFARNFLLPRGQALRATKENRAKFEAMKAELEARNQEKKGEAAAGAKSLDGKSFVLLRQAGEGGQLYGSVSARDIAAALAAAGFGVERGQIMLNNPIKSIGMFKLAVALHPEVEVTITVNVARSEDEAKRQARGEDLTITKPDEEEERGRARGRAEKFFEKPPAEMAAGESAEGAQGAAKPAARARPRRERKERQVRPEAKAEAAPAEGAKPAKGKEEKKEKREKKEKAPKG
jgi:large subunit ribosomal protein L9